MSLRELLDEEAGFDCEYGGGLSNHRPMALAALTRLGANNQQLTSFDVAYRQRLRPAPAHEDWPTGDAWASRLGDPAAWPVYRSLFAQWLEHEAAGDVLQQVLPRLTQGVGAAAFHGLIRTAYAVHSAHRQELADALAYWACRHLPLGEARTQRRAALDVEPALDRLPRLRAGGGLIFERMRSAAAQPGFSAATATLVIDESTLHRLAHHAAAMYTMSGSFTVLHLVTSAHAMRVLLPFVDDPSDERDGEIVEIERAGTEIGVEECARPAAVHADDAGAVVAAGGAGGHRLAALGALAPLHHRSVVLVARRRVSIRHHHPHLRHRLTLVIEDAQHRVPVDHQRRDVGHRAGPDLLAFLARHRRQIAPAQRLFGVKPAPCQQQVHRDMVGNALGQLDRGRVGYGARADFRQCEGGVFRAQDQVGGQCQLQSAATADAVDRADHRLVEVRELLQAAKTAHSIVAVDGIAIGCGLQVPTGAEELLALGAQDADAQAVIIAEGAEGQPHDPAGGQIDRVGLAARQRHLEDCSLAAGQDRAVGQHFHLSHQSAFRIRASTATAPSARTRIGLISISSRSGRASISAPSFTATAATAAISALVRPR